MKSHEASSLMFKNISEWSFVVAIHETTWVKWLSVGIFLNDFESSFLSFGVGFVFAKKHPPFYSVIPVY